MCSVLLLRRPGHPWPVLIGANRDEMLDRAWLPPGRHWTDRPDVTAGRDQTAGGSWLGINDSGVVAAILNRQNSLGPAAGKRSRGELVLEALDHADAAAAAEALRHLDPAAYRPFNLMVADNRDAFWVAHQGSRIQVEPIPTGLSMLTSYDLNDPASPRIRFYRPLFAAAAVPEPASVPGGGNWRAWQELLGSRIWDAGEGREAGPGGAMCIVTDTGFGTTSSALLALPSVETLGTKPVFLFCPGRPDRTSWQDVPLP
jgi:hypothetical protein